MNLAERAREKMVKADEEKRVREAAEEKAYKERQRRELVAKISAATDPILRDLEGTVMAMAEARQRTGLVVAIPICDVATDLLVGNYQSGYPNCPVLHEFWEACAKQDVRVFVNKLVLYGDCGNMANDYQVLISW